MQKVVFLTDEMVNDVNSEDYLDFTKAKEGFFLHKVMDFQIVYNEIVQVDAYSVMDLSGKVYLVPPKYVKFELNFYRILSEEMTKAGLTANQIEEIINKASNGL